MKQTILILASISIVLSLPAFISTGSYPSGIDTPAHLFKIETMQEMFQEHGTLYKWSTDWYGGYPFLSLYSPVTYYGIILLNIITGSLTTAYNLYRLFLLFTTGLLSYLILKREGDPIYALAGGILALTSYPLYNNLFNVGRVPFATGIVLFLLTTYLLFDDEIYTTDVTYRHGLLILSATALLYTHSMSAYVLALSMIGFAIAYHRQIASIGWRPLLVCTVITVFLTMPYIVQFVSHAGITDPTWIQGTISGSVLDHLVRQFGDIRPHYIGAVHGGLLLAGATAAFYITSPFLTYALSNTLVFLLLFWGANLGILQYIPFGSQFDLARFEAFFALFSVFVSVYGLKELVSTIDRQDLQYTALAALLILLAVDLAPMIDHTRNWSPNTQGELDELSLDPSYRSIGIGTRHWDDYLLPREAGTPNTLGWFMQSDPHYNYSITLQHTGGLWYPIDDRHPYRFNPELRKNLMQLSNTRYVFIGDNWVPEAKKGSVLGPYDYDHWRNKQARDMITSDPEFSHRNNLSTIQVYTLDREMDRCETVDPFPVTETYHNTAIDHFSVPNAFPAVPVDGTIRTRQHSTETAVNCTRDTPYSISITTGKPSWVLVKESYYPYWIRADSSKPVHSTFGFMVTHVNDTAHLRYSPGT